MADNAHRTRPVVLLIILAVVAGVGLFFYTIGPPHVLRAVQQAREASRRTQVENNLKQLELALKSYHQGGGTAVATISDDAWRAAPAIDHLVAAAEKGREFLVSLLDPSVDLLPEFPGSTTYWLYHDNYLAAKVLQKSHPTVAARIIKSIGDYEIEESGKIEILFGEAKEPLPFRHYKLAEVRRVDDKAIRTEVLTDQVMAGWDEYADLLLLAAIARDEKSDLGQALRMWDGIGFKDRAVETHDRYATYKLALALLAAAKLNESPPAREAMLERLLAQQNQDGGWITDYDRQGNPVGVANVETTSLAVLALDAVMK